MYAFLSLINVDALTLFFALGLVLGALAGLTPVLFMLAATFQVREPLPAPRNLLPRENLKGLLREFPGWDEELDGGQTKVVVAPGPYPQRITWSTPTEKASASLAPTFALAEDVRFLKLLEEAEEEAWAFQNMYEDELSI